MRSLSIQICAVLALILAATPVSADSPRGGPGIWEVDYACAPGMFGYVRNLDQLVEAIDQRSRLFPVNYSVKLDGDTVRVFDGGRIYVYRFVGENGLRIVRYSQLDGARRTGPLPASGRACT